MQASEFSQEGGMMNWAVEELKGIDLGDRRRNK